MKLRAIIIAIVAISLSVFTLAYFVYVGSLSLDVGIVVGTLAIVLPILLEVFLSPVVEYALRPKPRIVISSTHQEKHYEGSGYEKGDVKGYTIEATVTNRSRKICFNPEATLNIKDSQGQSPEVVSITFEETDDDSRPVDFSYRKIKKENYAWKIDGEIREIEKLMQNQPVDLIYPFEKSADERNSIMGNQGTVTYCTRT